MALTPTQEAVLQKLNDKLLSEHEAAKRLADSRGQKHPPAPVPLKPEQVEYPKWLHKDWKETDKAPGHQEPGKSVLVHSTDEEKAYVARGFSDAPPSKKK